MVDWCLWVEVSLLVAFLVMVLAPSEVMQASYKFSPAPSDVEWDALSVVVRKLVASSEVDEGGLMVLCAQLVVVMVVREEWISDFV